MTDYAKGTCKHCGGNIAIRNPSGHCDHMYWPELLTNEARKANGLPLAARARQEPATNAPRPADEILTDLLLSIFNAEVGMTNGAWDANYAMKRIVEIAGRLGDEWVERRRADRAAKRKPKKPRRMPYILPAPLPYPDSHQATSEGWCIIWSDSRARHEIQRDDEQDIFNTDEAALLHVQTMADQGSLYHRQCLEFIATHGDPK